MKILSSSEIRMADAHTIVHEPVTSIDLMERAATACFEWIRHRFDKFRPFKICCGTGNNGGDGLAIARMLLLNKYDVLVYILRQNEKSSDDFTINERRLRQINPDAIVNVTDEKLLPVIHERDVVVDAIFGTGLARPAEGLAASCIRVVNESKATVIAIDIPSGLFADVASDYNTAVIHAHHTLSFEVPKLAFMFAENHPYVGQWEVLNIGLDKSYIEKLPSKRFLADREMMKGFLNPRPKFSHKGMYGHALLVAGSHGKIGAAVLAARACLRSGVGLLTVHVPKCGYEIMQASVPEAMAETDADEYMFTGELSTENFDAIGIGCGIGTEKKTQEAFRQLLSTCKAPLVLDADAINILGLKGKTSIHLPENTILTPHPKEFERITEKAESGFHQHELQIDFAVNNKVFVVLKGAHTCVACPDGTAFFNVTGNPGMAKGGSGDSLTGIILSFLAQGYTPQQACLLGVYLHGSAGDLAAEKMSMQAMIAGDLIECLGNAFRLLEGTA